MVIKM